MRLPTPEPPQERGLVELLESPFGFWPAETTLPRERRTPEAPMTTRDPLHTPAAGDVFRWLHEGEVLISTVDRVRGDEVYLSRVELTEHTRTSSTVSLDEWRDWSGLEDVRVLHTEDDAHVLRSPGDASTEHALLSLQARAVRS